MKRVLVLGAGRVARPCVQYLLKQEGYAVTVVDLSEANLARVTGGHPRAAAIVDDGAKNTRAILESALPDVVVNLLPPPFMPSVSRQCLEAKVHQVHAIYLDGEAMSMAKDVEAAGLVFLGELGLDPGIDHMSAARTIKGIRDEGGQVESFRSICGAIPSAEANTNPWGYKLSWAPAALIGASKRTARILVDGQKVEWLDGVTYEHCFLEEVPNLGWFEVYANADSLPYLERYGIPEAKSIYRGTFRYPGWSETIVAMNALGLVEEDPQDLSGLSFRGFMARQAGSRNPAEAEEAVCRKLGIKRGSAVFERFAWLGLFDERTIPFARGSARDVIAFLFDERLFYTAQEKDLVILKDELTAFYPRTGKRLRHTSTLIDFGIRCGDSSIARTTGLPPAIAARFILEGTIRTPGVLTPVLPEIYGPVMEELEKEGIRMEEKVEELA